MKLALKGVVRESDLGLGAWILETDTGEIYELMQPAPAGLLQEGQRVQVTGTIRPDVMTIAAIGPVLAVETFGFS